MQPSGLHRIGSLVESLLNILFRAVFLDVCGCHNCMSASLARSPLLDGRRYLSSVRLQLIFMVDAVCFGDLAVIVPACTDRLLIRGCFRMYCFAASGRWVGELLPCIPLDCLGHGLAE